MKTKFLSVFFVAVLSILIAIGVSAASVVEVDDIIFMQDDDGFQVELAFEDTDYAGKLSVFLTAEDFASLTADSVDSIIHSDVILVPQNGIYRFAIRRDVVERAAGSSKNGTILYLIIGSTGNPTYHKAVPLLYQTEIAAVTGSFVGYDPGTATTLELIPEEGDPISCTVAPEVGSSLQTQFFTFPEVPAGTYRLKITKPYHLSYEISGLAVEKQNINLSRSSVGTIRLVGGDVNGDGMVTAMDIQKLWRVENGWEQTRKVDLNGDGILNEADYAVILAPENFGRSSTVLKAE